MEKKNKYSLWYNDECLLDFNTDDEILQYLNDNKQEYSIVSCSRGYYISIANPRYFVIPDLLYFLQKKPHE